MKEAKVLFKNMGELLSLQGVSQKKGRKPLEQDLSIFKNQALVCDGSGRILWIGDQKNIPSMKEVEEIDLGHRCVLPGFVECHTHSIFAGDRSHEFEMRNRGASYQEIAAAGGGILSTVNATRGASQEELLRLSQKRVNQFASQGVTCLEIKSGYGLNLETERKILQVAGMLKGPRIVKSFLGAHSIPLEFRSLPNGKDSYFQHVCDEMIPALAQEGLCDRLDIFVEDSYFDLSDLSRLSGLAKKFDLQLCVHADQLSSMGASKVGAQLGAVSVDHAVELSPEDRVQIAKSNTTAVMLPTADIYIHANYPNARALIDEGARVAIASDFNPGTSPTQDLSFVGMLSRLQLKMSLPECLAGYTYNAAAALGLESELGSLEVGKLADLCVLDMPWTELFYSVGKHEVASCYREGKPLWGCGTSLL